MRNSDFFPDCVKRRTEEKAGEAMGKKLMEFKKKMINLERTFKSSKCVLFCNCGHIAICVKCDETKGLDNCPVCKTKNYINEW